MCIYHKQVVSLKISRLKGDDTARHVWVGSYNLMCIGVHPFRIIKLHVEVYVASRFLYAQQDVIDVVGGAIECIGGSIQRIIFHRVTRRMKHDKQCYC